MNIVIALKMENSQCFESDRVKHNQVLQDEIAADNARMKDLMAKRRLSMHKAQDEPLGSYIYC